MGIWPDCKQVFAKPCTPKPCTCPAAQLEDEQSRQEARTNFRWRGSNGCWFREFSVEEVAQCTRDLMLRWVLYDGVPPPIVWRDLEVRYRINSSQLEKNLLRKMLPRTLGGN